MKGLKCLICLIGVCTLAMSSASHAAESTKGFSVSIEPSAQLELTLKPQSEIKIALFSRKPTKSTKNSSGILNSSDSYLGQLILSDKDCALGHKASINYRESNSIWLTQYAKTELAWESLISIQFEPQKKSNILVIRINNETLSITTTSKIKYLHISTKNFSEEINTNQPKLFDKE